MAESLRRPRAPGAVPSTPDRRLARPIRVECQWATDREAMLAALRVALGLPRALPHQDEEAA